MERLQGHLDNCNKELVSGWAIDLDVPERRVEVEIVQAGQTVAIVRPRFRSDGLRKALGLPEFNDPIYYFQIPFPLALGIKPGVPFDLRIIGAEACIQNGAGRVIPIQESRSVDAIEALRKSVLMFPDYWLAEAGDALEVRLRISASVDVTEVDVRVGDDVATLDTVSGWTADPNCLDKPTAAVHRRLYQDAVLGASGHALAVRITTSRGDAAGDRTLRFAENLRTLHVPKSLFNRGLLQFDLPSDEQIQRVSGPSGNQVNYLVGGCTTLRQLDAIARAYFGKRISQFPRILDWGVGCGRVLRQFAEDPEIAGDGVVRPVLSGVDIDPVNVEWCRSNLHSLASISRCRLDGFDLENASVDFLYGISVMTHLSEYYQGQWLIEIARVLSPGGVAILTTHGELAAYQHPQGIAAPFFERFGFFDGYPDSAIGQHMSGYYRATFQDALHVKSLWGRHLDVIDIIPATNAFRQDFVVLQKKPAR